MHDKYTSNRDCITSFSFYTFCTFIFTYWMGRGRTRNGVRRSGNEDRRKARNNKNENLFIYLYVHSE